MDFVNIAEEAENTTIIKVIGVGGGGSNAVQNMIEASLKGVTLIAANTDVQALRCSTAEFTIQLGGSMTKGLGAGADPTVGRDAALESIEAIKDCIGNADMVFVTKADNIHYLQKRVFTVTYIDKSPISNVVDELARNPYCEYDRGYVSDNLNHSVFSVYY